MVVYEGKIRKDMEGKGCNLIEIRCKHLGVDKGSVIVWRH